MSGELRDTFMAGSPEVPPMAGLRDRLAAALGEEAAGPNWADHVTELLYDGETVVESMDLGDARVVVTSHRVLAYTPDAEGAAFRQVDRPNVLGVSTGHRSRGTLLRRGGRWAVIGLVLLGVGAVVDMDAIVGDVDLGGGAGSQIGVGGVLGLVRTVLDLLRSLDEFLVVAGAIVLLLAAMVLGAYLRTREPTIVVAVAGEEPDIHLPRGEDDVAVHERLRAAISPGPSGRPEA